MGRKVNAFNLLLVGLGPVLIYFCWLHQPANLGLYVVALDP